MCNISLKALGMKALPPSLPSIISLEMGSVAYREFSTNDFERSRAKKILR